MIHKQQGPVVQKLINAISKKGVYFSTPKGCSDIRQNFALEEVKREKQKIIISKRNFYQTVENMRTCMSVLT